MVVTLLVLLYLGWETYRGYQVGFTKRIVNLVFAAIVFTAAILGQNPLGQLLYNQFSSRASTASQEIDLMLYRFAAFFIIFFIGRLLVRIFKRYMPDRKGRQNFAGVLNSVLGAVISLIASYFLVYVVLSMLNALQNQWFIQQTISSPLLRAIIYNTPGLSNDVFNNIFGISRTLA